jgi:hypothetical protein
MLISKNVLEPDFAPEEAKTTLFHVGSVSLTDSFSFPHDTNNSIVAMRIANVDTFFISLFFYVNFE